MACRGAVVTRAARGDRAVPRAAAPTPTPPSKLLQRYLASEATKISGIAWGIGRRGPRGGGASADPRAGARGGARRSRSRAPTQRAHDVPWAAARANDGDGLDGAARGVDAAAKAVRRARAASARADKDDAGVPLEVLKLARDVAKHIEASSRVLQDATAVLAKLEDPANERSCLEIRSERSTRTAAPRPALRRLRTTRALGRTAAQAP